MTRRRARAAPAPARPVWAHGSRAVTAMRPHAATVAVTVTPHGPGSPMAETWRSKCAAIVPPGPWACRPMLAPPQMGRFGGSLSVPSPLNRRLVAGFWGVPVSENEPSPFNR